MNTLRDTYIAAVDHQHRIPLGGNRVVSGSRDGTTRVWNVKTRERILKIKTGHEEVWAVNYSPDNTQIATGGFIGGLGLDNGHRTEETYHRVTWSRSRCSTQPLGSRPNYVNTISLSRNNRLLASASDDKTECETDLRVEPPLQHNLVTPEWCYPTSAYSIPSSTAGLFQWLVKWPPVPVLVLPHTTFAALSHPLLRIYIPFSNAFRLSITLDPAPMQQPNFSNAQVARK
ncbi:hypothetical protein CY34DRAFT_18206 [Suillus luteus UH-Slu-Lm8-n1]|uniref:Uncharacterized protein n=1 Tax=Suillus luteus UH-Slu-Lm8-n1 TaxID=930992 RepID=A0A0D0ANX3_9AGAM|nr:hypothetical protein CY34DRAFT_18206 [Suillus luteus UH-Slu-Lm8-n1]